MSGSHGFSLFQSLLGSLNIIPVLLARTRIPVLVHIPTCMGWKKIEGTNQNCKYTGITLSGLYLVLQTFEEDPDPWPDLQFCGSVTGTRE